MKTSFTVIALAALALGDTCPEDRPLSVCCQGDIAPYSSNSFIWGNQCGYYPADTSELDGGRCMGNTGPFSNW